MLTDSKIKALKAKEKLYKVQDCDGLYVAVSTTGTIHTVVIFIEIAY